MGFHLKACIVLLGRPVDPLLVCRDHSHATSFCMIIRPHMKLQTAMQLTRSLTYNTITAVDGIELKNMGLASLQRELVGHTQLGCGEQSSPKSPRGFSGSSMLSRYQNMTTSRPFSRRRELRTTCVKDHPHCDYTRSLHAHCKMAS